MKPTETPTSQSFEIPGFASIEILNVQYPTKLVFQRIQRLTEDSKTTLGDITEIENGEMLLLKFGSAEERDTIALKNSQRFRYAEGSKFKAESIDGNRQIGDNVGTFSLGNQHFLVIKRYNPLTDEIVPEKGIYKGVIVNPELYFSDDMYRQIQEISAKTRDIL